MKTADGSLIPKNLSLEMSLTKTKADEKPVFVLIRDALPIVRQGIVDIAYRYKVAQADVSREAARIGAKLLWTLDGITEIRSIRSEINHATRDQDFRGWFDVTSFSIKGSSSLSFRLDAAIFSECAGLASILGLNPNMIVQISLMAGLIHSEFVGYHDRFEMVQILKEFRLWISDRARKAEIMKRIVKECGNDDCGLEKKTDWHDVIDE